MVYAFPVVLGVTGGISCGKSEVCKLLRFMKFPVFDADYEVSALYSDVMNVMKYIYPVCPEFVLNGRVDKDLVFCMFSQRSQEFVVFETVVHNYVRMKLCEFLLKYRFASLVVLDIPLLLEKRFDKFCDYILCVYNKKTMRKHWADIYKNIDSDRFDIFASYQLSDNIKLRIADYVLFNCTRVDMCVQLKRILRDISKNFGCKRVYVRKSIKKF